MADCFKTASIKMEERAMDIAVTNTTKEGNASPTAALPSTGDSIAMTAPDSKAVVAGAGDATSVQKNAAAPSANAATSPVPRKMKGSAHSRATDAVAASSVAAESPLLVLDRKPYTIAQPSNNGTPTPGKGAATSGPTTTAKAPNILPAGPVASPIPKKNKDKRHHNAVTSGAMSQKKRPRATANASHDGENSNNIIRQRTHHHLKTGVGQKHGGDGKNHHTAQQISKPNVTRNYGTAPMPTPASTTNQSINSIHDPHTDTPVQEPPNDAFKFFVANVSFEMTATEVKRFFNQYGHVNFVKMIYHKDQMHLPQRKSRGFGFIYMMDQKSCQQLLQFVAQADPLQKAKITMGNRKGVHVEHQPGPNHVRPQPGLLAGPVPHQSQRQGPAPERTGQYGPPPKSIPGPPPSRLGPPPSIPPPPPPRPPIMKQPPQQQYIPPFQQPPPQHAQAESGGFGFHQQPPPQPQPSYYPPQQQPPPQQPHVYGAPAQPSYHPQQQLQQPYLSQQPAQAGYSYNDPNINQQPPQQPYQAALAGQKQPQTQCDQFQPQPQGYSNDQQYGVPPQQQQSDLYGIGMRMNQSYVGAVGLQQQQPNAQQQGYIFQTSQAQQQVQPEYSQYSQQDQPQFGGSSNQQGQPLTSYTQPPQQAAQQQQQYMPGYQAQGPQQQGQAYPQQQQQLYQQQQPPMQHPSEGGAGMGGTVAQTPQQQQYNYHQQGGFAGGGGVGGQRW
jgi:RNA recognition motif-containing protein